LPIIDYSYNCNYCKAENDVLIKKKDFRDAPDTDLRGSPAAGYPVDFSQKFKCFLKYEINKER
jgi:hypothetical protein